MLSWWVASLEVRPRRRAVSLVLRALKCAFALFCMTSAAYAQLGMGPSLLPDGVVGTTYGAQLSTTKGNTPWSFALAAGSALPAGLELYSNPSPTFLRGVPTVSGMFQFYIAGRDGSDPPITETHLYTLRIQQPATPFTFIASALPDAVHNYPYPTTYLLAGGTEPYRFNVSGSMPNGLSTDACGRLFGTVSQAPGTYNFTVTATDSSVPPVSIQRTFTLGVRQGVEVGSSVMGAAAVGRAWSAQIWPSGGAAPYTFAVTSGALPPGLALDNSTGVISGAPTSGGEYTFRITATDSAGRSGYADFTVPVALPNLFLNWSATPAYPGVPYSIALSASGWTAPYAWRLQTGYQLPAGWTFSSQGVLAGLPTSGGHYWFKVRLTDGVGRVRDIEFGLDVYDIVPATFLDATPNSKYSQQLFTSGFDYTSMTLESGTLPPGLQLVTKPLSGGAPMETIEGTPTATGSYTFTISALGSSGQHATRTYTMAVTTPVIAPEPLRVVGDWSFSSWVGEPYRYVYTASPSMSGPFTFSIEGGGLPPGLTLAENGVLSGAPKAAGVFSFTVGARTLLGKTATKTVTALVFDAHLTIGTETVPGGVVNRDYSVTFTPLGGTPPYGIYIDKVPPGLALYLDSGTSPAYAVLRGKPLSPGTFSFQVQAGDSSGNAGARAYSLMVTGTEVSIQPSSLPAFQWGVPYSWQLTVSGGAPPYQFSTACALPTGIALSASGLISGAPTWAGDASCLITVRDSGNGGGQVSYAIDFVRAPFTLYPTSVHDGQVGVIYYTASIAASGATAPVRFTISNGSLPPGLTASMPDNGPLQISGKPTTAGSFPFRVTATDGASHTVSLDYSLRILNQPIAIGPDTLPAGTVGSPYSATIAASGGTPPYTYSLSASFLPAGLTLDGNTGIISGFPAAASSTGFRIAAADSNGAMCFRDYQIVTTAALLTLTPTSLPAGQIRSPYSAAIQASGGTAPYSFSLSQGSLPNGLTLSAQGQIGGAPAQAGAFSFRIAARDSGGATGYAQYGLTIGGDTLTVGPATLADASVGQPYSAQLTASGGTPPYQFVMLYGMWSADLPLGLDGKITGTPTSAGWIYATVRATDANGSTGTGVIQLTIKDLRPTLSLAPAALPAGHIGNPYSATIQASGGTPPYTYSLTYGTLPIGLTLGISGVLSGTPSEAGNAREIHVTAEDTKGVRGTVTYQLQIDPDAITLGPTTLPDAHTGQAYSAQLTASGGKPPYYFESSSPMCGLRLGYDGKLGGIPTANTGGCGTVQFTVLVTDANVLTARGSFQVIVRTALYIPAQGLHAGLVGVPYSGKLLATNGTGPLTWSITSGALPPGLALAAAGTLSGTPSQAGNYAFTSQVMDGAGATATVTLTFSILNSPSIVSASPFTPGTVGTAYSQTFTASGGASVYTWSLTAGALPDGLTLASGGTLSGTPTRAGVFSFALQVSDGISMTAGAAFSLTIAPPPIAIVSASPLPRTAVGGPYSYTLVASGGSPPYSWTVVAGALPGGVSLSVDGTLSGTPVAGGYFGFTVRVQDSVSRTITGAFGLAVTAPTVIATVAGGAPAPSPVAAGASFGEPVGVAADSSGNVYFSALQNVFKIDSTGAVTLVAGTGRPGYSGDGGPAASASLSWPGGLAVDSSGNLYIADAGNNRVRKVSAGVITTVAGNGVRGESGDGGPATSATLSWPNGVAVSGSGNLYIAEALDGATVVRKVAPGGVISTVMGWAVGGPSTYFPSAIAVDASENVYVADQHSGIVSKVWVSGGLALTVIVAGGGPNVPGDGGPARSAHLGSIYGLACDATGNLYIAAGNIRKVTPAGVITTVAGNGSPGYSGDDGTATAAQLNAPSGVAIDGSGNLYLADTYNGRIRKVWLNGDIDTLAGAGHSAYSGDGGPATSAQLFHPSGTAVDASGNLFIADTANNRVRKVSPAGTITTVAGDGVAGHSGDGGPGASARLNSPSAVAVDGSGNLYIAEAAAVRKIQPGGIITTVAGNGSSGYSGDGGPATAAQLNGPSGLAFDASGNLFIADAYNGRIREVSAGGLIGTVAGNGAPGYSGDGGPATSAQISYPSGVAIDGAGNLYIAGGVVRMVSPGGSIATVASGGYASGVALDLSGNLYIAYPDEHRVMKVSSGGVAPVAGDGAPGYSGDGGPAAGAELWSPFGVTVDAAGNLYVADYYANAVRRVQPLSPLSITTPASPRAAVGVTYSRTLTAAGGLPPYSWSVVSGALPTGLSLSAGGAISGTPAAAGASSFTVQVTDSSALAATASFTLAVSAGALSVFTASPLTQGSVGAAYSQTLVAVGGTPPDSNWAVTNGALPPGVNLSAGGALSGAPTATGAYTFTAQVTDSAGATASASLQLTISSATYNVGDVAPYTADAAPAFGDEIMNILDLVQILFSVNNVPGFRPAACSDRFDAMDLYPVDVAPARGGDNALDIRDLIRELFRVNNLDPDRPVRPSRGGVCPGAPGQSAFAPAASAGPWRAESFPARGAGAQGALVLGTPEQFGTAEERIPLYLEARQVLTRVALTFALGSQRSRLRYEMAQDAPPSIAQEGGPGAIALAWLDGLTVRAADRLLLGYVIGPTGVGAELQVYGISSSGLDDNREVLMDASAMHAVQ